MILTKATFCSKSILSQFWATGRGPLKTEIDKTPEQADVYAGNQVRIARRSAGMSQMALAERLGVTFQQVQKYERARNRISVSMLVQIAKVLKKDISFFFRDSSLVGSIHQDVSGIWHYKTSTRFVDIHDAAIDALRHRKLEPTFFWFSETFAPILDGDSVDTLVTRWNEWRLGCKSSDDLLQLFTQLKIKVLDRQSPMGD